MHSRKKTKQKHEKCQVTKRNANHTEILQPRSKVDRAIAEDRNAELLPSVTQDFLFFIWYEKHQNDATSSDYFGKYHQLWTSLSHSLSSTVWLKIFLQESQTWTQWGEKMTQLCSAFSSYGSPRYKQFQCWKCLYMGTYTGIKHCSCGGFVHLWKQHEKSSPFP